MLARSTIWYLGAHIVSGAVSFLSIAVFTRILSPADFGLYGIVLAIVGVTNGFAVEWLRRGYLRLAPARCDGDRGSLFAVTLSLTLALCGLIALAATVWNATGLGLLGLSAPFVWLLIVLVAGRSVYDLVLAHLRAGFEVRWYGATLLGRAVLALLLGAGLGTQVGVTGVLIGLVAGWLLPSFVVLFKRVGNGCLRANALRKGGLAEIVQFSYPLIFVAGLEMSMQFSDRLLLSGLLGSEPAGFYTAVTDLVRNSLVFLMTVVSVAAFPILMRRHDLEGSDAGAGQLADNLVLLAGIAAPTAVALLLARHEITPIMVAAEYREAVLHALPLVVLVGLIFGFKAFYLDHVFHLAKRPGGMVLPGLLGLTVNLVVGYFAIREFGLLGAIYGSGLGYLAAMGMSWHRARRLICLRLPGLDLGKILLAAGVMGLAMSIVDFGEPVPNLIVKVGVGGLAYAALILLFNPRSIRQTVFATQPPER